MDVRVHSVENLPPLRRDATRVLNTATEATFG
jgi:hypothetical protein